MKYKTHNPVVYSNFDKDSIGELKKSLRKFYPEIASSHISEMIAAAFGFQKYASLLESLNNDGGPGIVTTLELKSFYEKASKLGIHLDTRYFLWKNLENYEDFLISSHSPYPYLPTNEIFIERDSELRNGHYVPGLKRRGLFLTKVGLSARSVEHAVPWVSQTLPRFSALKGEACATPLGQKCRYYELDAKFLWNGKDINHVQVDVLVKFILNQIEEISEPKTKRARIDRLLSVRQVIQNLLIEHSKIELIKPFGIAVGIVDNDELKKNKPPVKKRGNVLTILPNKSLKVFDSYLFGSEKNDRWIRKMNYALHFDLMMLNISNYV